jgi:hypothetical protein
MIVIKKPFAISLVSKDTNGKERRLTQMSGSVRPIANPLLMEDAIRRDLPVDDRGYLTFTGKGDTLTVFVSHEAIKDDARLTNRLKTAIGAAFTEHGVSGD